MRPLCCLMTFNISNRRISACSGGKSSNNSSYSRKNPLFLSSAGPVLLVSFSVSNVSDVTCPIFTAARLTPLRIKKDVHFN